ncbi:MAG: Mfa1 fimbrilin C-terminal domain-containing protein, partial [Muribaculaceae bacterium]|nr:Mfa1 fimbrilin C-terminal domain-containing protein [Muribaculaceae bacterium]
NGNFKAIAYNNGAMVYPIPLEHLNNPKGEDAVEGQWGVVRNHSYRVNVTKLVTLGNGVFRPEQVGDDEAEIIDPEKPKTPTYYVESKINILSWKIVSQDVEI